MYILFLVLLLGLIPASIAKNKGYSFGLWYLYGVCLWIVAFIHSICLQDKNEMKQGQFEIKEQYKLEQNKSKPELLLKYKELLDQGIITVDEFNKAKEQFIPELVLPNEQYEVVFFDNLKTEVSVPARTEWKDVLLFLKEKSKKVWYIIRKSDGKQYYI